MHTVPTVLVTGATGFIGRPTCAVLSERGARVHRVSRTSRRWPGAGAWHTADLLRDDPAALLAEARPDVVVHLAWVAPPQPYLTHADNLRWADATLRLATAARDAGVRRQVFAGSSLEHAPPTSAYASAKLALLDALEVELDGTSWAWARIFQVYGPGEPAGRLVPSVAREVSEGRIARCTDGRAIRDFIHVEDVAHALATLVERDVDGTLDLGTGRATRVADLALTLARLAGRPDAVELGALPSRPGEPPRLVADTRPLRSLDALPRISLELGLAEILRLHRRVEHAA